MTVDRALHDRGSFARGLHGHGVVLRQAGLETPEHIGRCERHGGTVKRITSRMAQAHEFVGEENMKTCAAIAQDVKNPILVVEGSAPHQWILGRAPRSPGHLLDEAEAGFLGVLQAQVDGHTIFTLQARLRETARKAFVELDCGRRFQAAVLRNAAPTLGPFKTGDIIMYHRLQGATTKADEWRGPCVIIGFDQKAVWVQDSGVPVLTATTKLRSPTAAELYAYQLSNGSFLPAHVLDTSSSSSHPSQRRLVDLSWGTVSRFTPTSPLLGTRVGEASHPGPPQDPQQQEPQEQPQEQQEPQQPREPLTSLPNIPMQKKPRFDDPDFEMTLAELWKAHYPTPLERHLGQSGNSVNDPGIKLLRKLAEKPGTASSSSRGRSRSSKPIGRDALCAFMADQRSERPDAAKEFDDHHNFQVYWAERFIN